MNDIEQKFQAGFMAHSRMFLAEAEQQYRQVLTVSPSHVGALHLLGVVYLQRGEFNAAVPLLCRSIELKPEFAEAHNNLGMTLQQIHRFFDAEACYRRALLLNADLVEAHNNLGFLLQNMERPQEAEASYKEALRVNPEYAEAHYNLGNLLRHVGRPPEAERCYRQALTLKPDYVESYNNLGLILKDTEQLVEAEACFRRAIAFRSNYAEAYNNLGTLLQNNGQPSEAEAAYRKALYFQPLFAGAHNNLGNLLRDAHRFSEAEACFRKALEINRDDNSVINNLGRLLHDMQRPLEAEGCYRQALTLAPDCAETHNNLGVLLRETQRSYEAEASFRQSLALQPDFSEARNNLGVLLQDTQRLFDAEVSFRHALALKPDNAKAHNNLGVLLQEAGRLFEAEMSFREALALEPNNSPFRFNLSLILLAMGRYKEAWPLYETRYTSSPGWGIEGSFVQRPHLQFAQWQGESLEDKTLLVWPEQGFGDSIQFARFLPLLKARGLSRLSVACSPSLKTLFEGIEGVDTWVNPNAPDVVPTHDYWCFFTSLALHFDITLDSVPRTLPYLGVSRELTSYWQLQVPAKGFKVGIAWAGDPRPGTRAHLTDRRRSLHVRAFLPLVLLSNITFINLQKGQVAQEQLDEISPKLRPLDLMNEVENFADTAAIIQNLDLVITVDTAVAHLAGALNKPVWILSRFDGCWRWLQNRDDSPWYPGVARVFRQEHPGEWGAVIAKVAEELIKVSSVDGEDASD